MPGPLQAAGAAPEPTEYAPLTMDRYITGLWTQRSELRDADTPYLYAKYYSATRFDSLLDGLNREVTSKLTLKRRPGHSVYNSQLFPRVRSFFAFKYQQDGQQKIQVLADTAANVWDATGPDTKTNVLTKTAGAGPTRFLAIGSELFMTDGIDQKKIFQPAKTWQPNTAYQNGDVILDPNGNLQVATQTTLTANIAKAGRTTASLGTAFNTLISVSFTAPIQIQPGTTTTLAGLTTYPDLNGTYAKPQYSISQAGASAIQIFFHPLVAPADEAFATETGTATFASSAGGTSGATPPAIWNAALGGTTADGTMLWTNFGPPVQNWQVPGPTNAPTILNNGQDRWWQPGATIPNFYSVIDSNQLLEVAVGGVTGPSEPTWNKVFGGHTADGSSGGVLWTNCGNIGSWTRITPIPTNTAIIDSNQNLQVNLSVSGGSTGTTPPSSWGTNLGDTTTDGTVVWTNCGPGVGLAYGSVSYCYAYHSVDGSVSTASPLATIPNGILGPAGGYSVTLQGITSADPQIVKIDIFRTAQGGSIPLLLISIPNPTPGVVSAWTFTDTLPDSSLNPFIPAPINHAGDPPPAGATAPVLHLQRIWMKVGSRVIWSGGPTTLTGSGFTAFPPANTIDFQEELTRFQPITTNSGPGLLVIGTANTFAILGRGIDSDPFYPMQGGYMQGLGCLNYDAITVVSSTTYIFTNNSKLAVIDPGGGYMEAGFPIGDQFDQMTTGGQTGQIFDPATAYVSWYEKKSGDTALYVADGNVGWFRYSPIAAPESGYLWSPFAAVVGGTSAVQTVETTTGKVDLLVGPAATGPILKRDTSVYSDNEEVYDSWAVLGNIVLCESGEVAEIAHIALDSYRLGDRPVVGMLYSEVKTTPILDFDLLTYTSVDPPLLDEALTLYSDRYSTMQDGVCPKCTHCQVKIDWGRQDTADELLTHTVFGAKFSERRQAA